MTKHALRITLVGGPTAVLEARGVRLLTGPTFDPPGGQYTSGPITLKKIAGPALKPDGWTHRRRAASHDQHYDNLDHAGRDFMPHAGSVITTPAGAQSLGRVLSD